MAFSALVIWSFSGIVTSRRVTTKCTTLRLIWFHTHHENCSLHSQELLRVTHFSKRFFEEMPGWAVQRAINATLRRAYFNHQWLPPQPRHFWQNQIFETCGSQFLRVTFLVNPNVGIGHSKVPGQPELSRFSSHGKLRFRIGRTCLGAAGTEATNEKRLQNWRSGSKEHLH